MNNNPIQTIDFTMLGKSNDSTAINDVLSNLFVYLIHQNNLEIGQKGTFLKILAEKNIPMLEMAKQFAIHLINNFSDEVVQELSAIQTKGLGFKNMLNNDGLVDFVEMELVDPTTTYRKWEFGKFAIEHFINDIHNTELEKIKIDNEIGFEEFLELFASNLDTQGTKLDDQEKLFLIVTLRHRLYENKLNIPTYEVVGSSVHRNLLGMSLRMDILKNSFRESLSLTIENQNRKGHKR
ncbi:hypothetical protein PY092_19455 [Muricauda sp. 334s03]|uniref:Uncharacterized protein n=1 Tax=Flagellimonas yonaguniensis TaxID=3031325 RepID=A0ABT5Y4H3_9FLAO|nr:hypothetical protein [[Muricauda] yonaguniensis]MDF0718346.1 hypothetical protein [[Muricauda] yonaguniensis]